MADRINDIWGDLTPHARGTTWPARVDRGLHGSTPWASSLDRLTQPLIHRDGQLVETDWETAMSRIVEASQQLLTDKGPLCDRELLDIAHAARADTSRQLTWLNTRMKSTGPKR